MIGPDVFSIGLGCSRIASLTTKASQVQISRLLDQAWDGGIRVYDTADIYGQGDSERRLAKIAARSGSVIITKAGLALSRNQAAIRMIKPMLRPVLQKLKGANRAAAKARADSETHDLEPDSLERRLEQSLKRLRREAVDVFLLHSPPLHTLSDGRLFDVLDRIKTRGLAKRVGVSVQFLEDAAALISAPVVDVLQVPLRYTDLSGQSAMLDAAKAKGISIVAREVLGNDLADVALPPLVRDPRVTVVLTGTTSPVHLAQNLKAAGC